jgi:hypothetical protein
MLGAPLLGPVPASAQEASAAAAAAETVTIPFAPPLLTPVTYAMRFERKRPGGDTAIDFDQQLTFERLDSGYLLRIETLSMTSGGRRFDLADRRMLDALPPAIRLYLLPMAIELDASGEMVRMRDWPAMQAALRGMPEAAAKMSDQPMNEAALAVVRRFLEPIINASAEDAPAFMIRGWPAVLGYGGAEFDLGEAVAVDTEVTGGLLPVAVPATMKIVLTRTTEGDLRLAQTAHFDPEAMRAALLMVIETMREAAQLRGKAAQDDDLQAMEITDEMEITFDPLTGLPVSARTARLTSVETSTESASGGDIMTLRRISP